MGSEQYSCILTDLAESDLDLIYDCTANELLDRDEVSSFADALEAKLEEMCKAPKTGRLITNPCLKRKEIRRISVENYIVFYLIDDAAKQIIILRIIYGKRDLNKILKSIEEHR